MKKGFTLIELLGVLVLIAAIFLIVMPLITGQLKDSEKDIDASKLKIYCSAAKLYTNKENYQDSLKKVELSTLESAGILTNLDSKYRDKSIYVQYVGNYYCCCNDQNATSCISEYCQKNVTK